MLSGLQYAVECVSYDTDFVFMFYFRKRLFIEGQIFILISPCFGRSQCNEILDQCCTGTEVLGQRRSEGGGP